MDNKPEKAKSPISIGGLVLLLILGFVLSDLLGRLNKELPTLTLTEIVKKIKSREIERIVIQGAVITIYDKNGGVFNSSKQDFTDIVQTLRQYGVSEAELQNISIEVKQSSGGWGFLLSFLPITILILFLLWMSRSQGGQMGKVFSFARAKIQRFDPKENKITFNDVAGLKEVKEELGEIVDFLKEPSRFLKLGSRIPKGVLLIGQPGTGKTLVARAVAGEASVPFFFMSGSDFMEMFVGVGASRVRDAFDIARKEAPAILFIDEIDALGRSRGTGLGQSHDEREQTLNQILVELDGFNQGPPVIMIAATNRPDILDPAFTRAGRFDRQIIFDLPDLNEREAILKVHAQSRVFVEGTDLRRIAERTPGVSGADLANIINEASLIAGRRKKETIEQIDLYDAVEKTLLGVERKSHTMLKREKKMVAYHETGHALIAYYLNQETPDVTDPVQKISIISRGKVGGYTFKVPTEDRNFRMKKGFLAELTIAHGGYAAEMIKLGDVSTGASNDLNVATAIARAMVMKYGMSEKMGTVTFGDDQGLLFLGKSIVQEKNYSEETARKIDEEVRGLMNEAEFKARKIINDNMKKFESVVVKLLEKETLEKEEFETLMVTNANNTNSYEQHE